jgi:hypothetical protein
MIPVLAAELPATASWTVTFQRSVRLRSILAYLDVPTLGQPEAFIHAKDGLFDRLPKPDVVVDP